LTEMPDLGGFEMATQIESTVDGRVILWFFRIDRDRGLWIQVQVTLVGASLKRANLEILQAMPKLRSWTQRIVNTDPQRMEFKLDFEPGTLCYECEDVVCSEFTRKVHMAPEVNE
jgi:hypothetical protein